MQDLIRMVIIAYRGIYIIGFDIMYLHFLDFNFLNLLN